MCGHFSHGWVTAIAGSAFGFPWFHVSLRPACSAMKRSSRNRQVRVPTAIGSAAPAATTQHNSAAPDVKAANDDVLIASPARNDACGEESSYPGQLGGSEFVQQRLSGQE